MDPQWEEAIVRGDATAVRALLDRGMDPDARDRYGQTGLMLAAHAGHGAIVDLLIAHGANLDVTAKFGLSAVMLAVVAGRTEVARQLARAGCNLSLRGTGAPGFAGKTAAELADARGLSELAGALKGGQ